MTPRIVRRGEWGHTAPLGPLMTLPVAELYLHHSVTTMTNDPFADMRAIERIGVQRFGRFSYSWAYHARARMFLEGAGDTIGAHTGGHNSTSLGLVLIGDYTVDILSPDHISDLGWCIQHLITANRLVPGTVYPTAGHRDLKATACPGDNAYNAIPAIRAAVAQEDDMLDDKDKQWIRSQLGLDTDLTKPVNLLARVQDSLKDPVVISLIADAVVKRIPASGPGGLTPEQITAAVKAGLVAALKEGVG